MRRWRLFLKQRAPGVGEHRSANTPGGPCGQCAPKGKSEGDCAKAERAEDQRAKLSRALPTYMAVPEQPCRAQNRAHREHHIEQRELPDVTAIVVAYENREHHHEWTDE